MNSQQLYKMALLALHCGLRAGEIFNLTWGDVDLKEGTLLIRDPKNRTNRVAYMTEEVKAMFKAKDKGEPGELVFNSKNGGRIREIYNSFDRVVNALGLNEGKTDPQNRVVFHTLRHTFASWLAIQGTPLHVIKELLGHKTLKMTERYSHLMPDVKKRAVQALEGAFREANSQGKVMELKTEEED